VIYLDDAQVPMSLEDALHLVFTPLADPTLPALAALEVPMIGFPALKNALVEVADDLPVALLVCAPLKLAEPVLVAAHTLLV